jgi:hypothetical protein
MEMTRLTLDRAGSYHHLNMAQDTRAASRIPDTATHAEGQAALTRYGPRAVMGRSRAVTGRSRAVTIRSRAVTIRSRAVTIRSRAVTIRSREVTGRSRAVGDTGHGRRGRGVRRAARWPTRRLGLHRVVLLGRWLGGPHTAARGLFTLRWVAQGGAA